VRSPTYTLVEPYALARDDGELELYHFDLYRFADPAEWADAGFREYFDAGAVCLVEWPQKAGALLGTPDLVFSLDTIDADRRMLEARAYSESGKACLERC
jgi:tRNA threonylcarbamoyladenosine biosynthesis protein TsaE